MQSLLKDQVCVCGRELGVGTPEWNLVQGLLKRASNAEILSRVVRARSRISYLNEMRRDAPKLLEAEHTRLTAARQERREIEQKIDELGQRLKDLPLGEIAEREIARQKLVKDRTEVTKRIGAIEITIQRSERALKEKQAEQARIATRSSQARKLVTRYQLAERAAEVLEAILEQHEEEAREFIANEVNAVLDKTARRAYKFGFKENFAFDITYADGRPVPRSSGENQLVSLAFIAALIKFSMSRTQQGHSDLLIPGVVAPLVLDSPFGQLDTKYRLDTASFVPQMAAQIVLFVSSSQGDDQVLSALQGHIGREYVLISENIGERGDRSSDAIVFKGKSISTSLFNSEKNLTRIQELEA